MKTSLTNVLKAEIARVARKELKDELLSLRKATTAHRSEIAAFKRELKTLRSQLKANEKVVKAVAPQKPAEEAKPGRKVRFTAESFAAQRARLGISQAQMAQLLGVSGLSVYKWESGKVQPRAKQLEAIAGLRGLGKREAAARLAAA